MELKRTLRKAPILLTEDGIAVYNIVIDQFPKNFDKKVIVNYFAQFGQIKDIDIMYGRTRSRPKQCTIKYVDAASATVALKKRNHHINRQRVMVKACPSWEQPFTIDDNEVPTGTTVVNSNNNISTTTLLKLNDYCLEIIFQQLNLQYQIRLSLCHPRLEQVFARMISPRLQRRLNFNEIHKFSTWELRQYFRTAGLFLESIEVLRDTCYKSIIYDLMREHCANVQRLQVMCRHFIYANFINSLNMQIITELELFQCDISEKELKNFTTFRNLNTLGLACNRNISGEHLPRMSKVQRLSLYECRSVTQETLVAICKALQLRYLDIRLNEFNNLNEIVEHCTELETLKMSRIIGGNQENIAKLPKLKSLEMHHICSAMPSSFYSFLADYHSDDMIELKLTGQTYSVFPTVGVSIANLKKLRVLWLGDNENNTSIPLLKSIANLTELEELNIHYSIRIRGDHILPIIRQCTKLKRMNLSNCRYISEDFVLKAITILEDRVAEETQSRRPSRKQPLLVLVAGTRINKEILKYPSYLNARHLLQLSYRVKIPLQGLINEESPFDISNDDSHLIFDYGSSEGLFYSGEDEYDDNDDDNDDDDYSRGWSSENDNDDFNVFYIV